MHSYQRNVFSFIQPLPKVRRQCRELAVGFTGAESWCDAVIPFRSWHHTTSQRAFAYKRSFSSLGLILFHLFFDFSRPSPPKLTPAHIRHQSRARTQTLHAMNFLLATSGLWLRILNSLDSLEKVEKSWWIDTEPLVSKKKKQSHMQNSERVCGFRCSSWFPKEVED